jgi:hypothetical protein
MKRIYIEWYDAYTLDSWTPVKDAIELTDRMYLVKSIGWLLSKNKKRVIISHTINPVMTMGVLHIPVSCIKKIKIINSGLH